MGDISVKRLKRVLEDALERIEELEEDYGEDAIINSYENTYYVRSQVFVSLPSSGFVSLDNLEVEDEDEEYEDEEDED